MAPRTIVGKMLEAMIVGDDPSERSRLTRALNGGQAGINEDEPAVVARFCELVLRHATAQVGRVPVVAMAAEFANRQVEFTEEDARQQVLASLGEGEQVKLTPGRTFQLQLLLAGFALLKLRANPAVVRELIGEAEDQAFADGFGPPVEGERPSHAEGAPNR